MTLYFFFSALKKSRRYAKSIDQRFPSHDFIAKLDQDNSDLSNKLEFDLMQHWRSLFVHTENILTVESTQIVSESLPFFSSCLLSSNMIAFD